MKLKKLFSSIALSAAMLLGIGSVAVPTYNADAAEIIVCETTSAYEAVRFTQQRKVSEWRVENGPTGQIYFTFETKVKDWSNATHVRFRITSHRIGDAPADSKDNNLAFGYDGKLDYSYYGDLADLYESIYGDTNFRMINSPYSDVKFTNKAGASTTQLYFINDQIPYFNMGRLYTGYIQAALTEETFQLHWGEKDSEICWRTDTPNGTTIKAPVDLAHVDHFFLKLEPKNYGDMCIDIGNVEIKVDGAWITAVDVSQTTVVTRAEGGTWEQAIDSLTENQCIMEPNSTAKWNNTTTTFTAERIAKTPCAEHSDGNSDGVCDRCFESIPHELWDIDMNDRCDDCGNPYCAECTDENADGICDECNHYVEFAPPPTSSSPSQSGTNSSTGKKKGCKGVIGGASVGALLALGAIALVRKKND